MPRLTGNEFHALYVTAKRAAYLQNQNWAQHTPHKWIEIPPALRNMESTRDSVVQFIAPGGAKSQTIIPAGTVSRDSARFASLPPAEFWPGGVIPAEIFGKEAKRVHITAPARAPEFFAMLAHNRALIAKKAKFHPYTEKRGDGATRRRRERAFRMIDLCNQRMISAPSQLDGLHDLAAQDARIRRAIRRIERSTRCGVHSAARLEKAARVTEWLRGKIWHGTESRATPPAPAPVPQPVKEETAMPAAAIKAKPAKPQEESPALRHAIAKMESMMAKAGKIMPAPVAAPAVEVTAAGVVVDLAPDAPRFVVPFLPAAPVYPQHIAANLEARAIEEIKAMDKAAATLDSKPAGLDRRAIPENSLLVTGPGTAAAFTYEREYTNRKGVKGFSYLAKAFADGEERAAWHKTFRTREERAAAIESFFATGAVPVTA